MSSKNKTISKKEAMKLILEEGKNIDVNRNADLKLVDKNEQSFWIISDSSSDFSNISINGKLE